MPMKATALSLLFIFIFLINISSQYLNYSHYIHNEELSDCDPISPDYCLSPFPNSFWLKINKTRETNLQTRFAQSSFPVDIFGVGIDPEKGGWNDNDGFSPSGPIQFFMSNISIINLPNHDNIEKSLDKDSPLILIDVEEGKKIPFWSELDQSENENKKEGGKMLLIWPAKKLENSKRYVVGVRNLINTYDNSIIQPSQNFIDLRDNKTSSNPDINLRRPLFEDMFQTLAGFGFDRSSLQLCFDFVTGSLSSITGRLTTMRNDSLSRLPSNGVTYTITNITDNSSEFTRRFIEGSMQVPLYLDNSNPGSHLVLDNNVPVFQGFTSVPFVVQIPNSLVQTGKKGRIVQYGHGLFGNRFEIQSTFIQEFANTYGYIMVAVDWWGMCDLDQAAIVKMISLNLTDFMIVPDRIQQAMVNQIYLTKLLTTSFVNDPSVMFNNMSIIDPTLKNYNGNSLGGILGSLFMSVTPDIENGFLGVPGGPFSLLLLRSVDFSEYYSIVKARYSSSLDDITLITLIQQLWDRGDPIGYVDLLRNNSLNFVRNVAINYGIGDCQVTWLGAEMLGRSIGNCKVFQNNTVEGLEKMFGFDVVTNIIASENTCILEAYDFGAPSNPNYNVPPPNTNTDVHGCPRKDLRSQSQMDYFFRTKTLQDFCRGQGCHLSVPNFCIQQISSNK